MSTSISNQGKRIDLLVAELYSMASVDSIETSDEQIVIEYSNNLSLFEKGLGYNLEDFVEPEQYTLSGRIELSFDGKGEITDVNSDCDVYSCQAEKNQGDWRGFEIDYQSSFEDAPVTEALETLLSEFQELENAEAQNQIQGIEVIGENTSLWSSGIEIGKREGEDELFYRRWSNESINPSNVGQATWLTQSEYEAQHLNGEDLLDYINNLYSNVAQ